MAWWLPVIKLYFLLQWLSLSVLYGWDIISLPKKEAYLFSGLFIEFLHLLNITCFFQWVTVWETRKASTSQELVFTYKVLLFLNFLCYPLIKILAVILWQMFRDFSGQFLPAYQGEYTKHRQNLLTAHMLYTKYVY